MKKLWLLLALSSVYLVSNAYSDVTYTFQITDRFGEEPSGQRIEKLYVKGDKIKIAVEGETAQIIDLTRQNMIFIDYANQTFSRVNAEELNKQLVGQNEAIRAAFATFQEKDNVTSADPTNEPFYRVKELGEKRKHQDWECRTLLVESDQRTMEICAATGITGQAELNYALELLQIQFQDIPFLTDALRSETLLLSQNLFPVQTTTQFGPIANGFSEEKWLSKIDASALNENVFDPPSDFKQIDENAAL